MATEQTTDTIMKYLKLIILSLGLTLGLDAAAQEQEIVLDRIVAVVNDGVVLESELNNQLRTVSLNLAQQNIAMPPADVMRSQVLESLILKRIQLQRIDSLGMNVSDEEVNRTLQLLSRQNGITLSELPAALANQGLDYATYREEVREQIALEQLRSRDVNSRVNVTRTEVDKLIANSAPDNLEYEVLHILLATAADASDEENEAQRKKAEGLYERLNNGEDFGPLAIAYSNASGVLADRGNLGYLKADALPSIFAEQIQALSPGETAPPVKSSSGYHLVQLNDIRGIEKVMTQQRLARHILVLLSEVVNEQQARQEILDIQERLRNGEDFAELARSESDDTVSANKGGDLGWAAPGNFVPEFDRQLEQLEKGGISEPFRSAYGWHIAQLLDVREHDATLDVRRNEAARALHDRKVQEESQTWVSQMRDEAYVEIRLDNNSS